MIRLHDPECCCATCESVGLGILAYRAIADELGSDDPAVIDPIWRERCLRILARHSSIPPTEKSHNAAA